MRSEYSYFLQLSSGGPHVGQSNPLIVEKASLLGPIDPGSWSIAVLTDDHDAPVDPSYFTLTEIVGSTGGADTCEVAIDPAVYDTLTAPDSTTYIRMRLSYTSGGSTPPLSFQRTFNIYPRIIESPDFLYIDGAAQASQTVIGIPLLDDGSQWNWSATPGPGLDPNSLTFTTNSNGQEATLVVTNPGDWAVTDHPISLVIESLVFGGDGTVSRGEFPGLLTLRKAADTGIADVAGFTFWRGQSSGGPALNAALDPGTNVTVSNPAGLPVGFDVQLDDQLAITSVTAPGATYTESGSIDLDFQQGVRPASTWAGVVFNLREFVLGGGTNVDIEFEDAAGSEIVTVSGTEGWTWPVLNPTGGVSVLNPVGGSNQVDLQWAQHALDPGAAGSLEVTVLRDDGLHPESVLTLDVNIGTPAQGLIEVSADPGGGVPNHTLQTGRERLRWQDFVYLQTSGGGALPALVAGQTLEFFVVGGAPIEFSEASKDASSSDPFENLLRTPLVSSGDQFIPDGWAASSPRTIAVRVVLRDGTGVLAGGNTVELSLPVQATADAMHVAVLLDRSGSMMQNMRWQGAISGAHWFATQVALDTAGVAHQVGVYWFAGSGGGLDANYPSIQPLGSPQASYGVLNDPSTGTDLAFTDFSSASSAWLTALLNTATTVSPWGWTAIGSGLLHARDELHALDPAGTTGQRVILALSDGQENRLPLIEPGGGVFTGGQWSAASATYPGGGDPNTRFYAGALATTDNWVDVLRNACEQTGGIPELDVKSFPNAMTAGADIGTWFSKNFAALFGFTTVAAPPDPPLGTGDMDTYTALVTHGHTRLIFTLFQNGMAADDEWELLIEPPATVGSIGGTLDLEQLEALEGVEVINGPMYRSVILDLPLQLEGQGFRWAGEWKMHVTRTGAGEAEYAATILAKEDVGTRVVIDTKPRPGVGDPICIRAFVGEGEVEATKVVARTTVTPAESWRGELLAGLIAEAESEPPLIEDEEDSGDDGQTDVDLRQGMASAAALAWEDGEPRPSFSVKLEPVSPGVYEGCFTPDAPGDWVLDTTIEGFRAGKLAREISAKVSAQLEAEVRKHLRGGARRDALETLALGKGHQAFRHEDRSSVSVRFVADEKLSQAKGHFRKKRLLRLSVRPTAHDGTLLGPGWASRIAFVGARGQGRFEVNDAGTGTYWADIELESKGELHYSHGWVSGQALRLLSARKQAFSTATGRLKLSSWEVEVLGRRLPVRVLGRLMPARKVDAHLRLSKNSLYALIEGRVQALASKDKSDQAVYADLFAELRPSLGRELPVRPSTRKAWTHGLKLALNATVRAVQRVEDACDRDSLSALADALEQGLERIEGTEGEAFVEAAEELDALVDAVRALGPAAIS